MTNWLMQRYIRTSLWDNDVSMG